MPTPSWLLQADLPTDSQGRKYIGPSQIDQILDQFPNWRNHVNAGGKNLTNLGGLAFNGAIALTFPAGVTVTGLLTASAGLTIGAAGMTVQGGASIAGGLAVTSGGQTVVGTLQGTSAAAGTSLILSDATNSTLRIKHASGSKLIFETDGTSNIQFRNNSLDRVIITSDGKVGVGMTSPTATLHVTGTITATSTITGSTVTGTTVTGTTITASGALSGATLAVSGAAVVGSLSSTGSLGTTGAITGGSLTASGSGLVTIGPAGSISARFTDNTYSTLAIRHIAAASGACIDGEGGSSILLRVATGTINAQHLFTSNGVTAVTQFFGAMRNTGLGQYANNTAALTGGLIPGDFYLILNSNPRMVACVF